MLEDFMIVQNESSIILDWTIKEGNVCDGLKIFRSEDAQNYEKIGEFFGVCGNISEPQDYTFQDDSPIANSYNYYRLELGFNGVSSPVSIYYVDFGENTSLFAPNPCSDRGVLHFYEDGDVLIQIYDSKGGKVKEFRTIENSVEINLSAFSNGIYYYRIIGESTIYRGRIVRD